MRIIKPPHHFRGAESMPGPQLWVFQSSFLPTPWTVWLIPFLSHISGNRIVRVWRPTQNTEHERGGSGLDGSGTVSAVCHNGTPLRPARGHIRVPVARINNIVFFFFNASLIFQKYNTILNLLFPWFF